VSKRGSIVATRGTEEQGIVATRVWNPSRTRGARNARAEAKTQVVPVVQALGVPMEMYMQRVGPQWWEPESLAQIKKSRLVGWGEAKKGKYVSSNAT
jgi:hypothetical protein